MCDGLDGTTQPLGKCLVTGGFGETYMKVTRGGEKHVGSQMVHVLRVVVKNQTII